MADPACAPLRQRAVSDSIRAAVVWQLQCKDADVQVELHRCGRTADGFTEATLVAHVKGTGRVHSFKVTVDAQGQATSVRHDGVHVQTQRGWDGKGATGGRGGAAGAKRPMTREEITKWVWVSIGIAAALAIIIAIIVFVVKQKQKNQDANVGAAFRKGTSGGSS